MFLVCDSDSERDTERKFGKMKNVESLLGLSGQLVFDTAQGIPFRVKKVAPGWQSPPDDLQLYTGKATGARPAGEALWSCTYSLLWW